MPPYIPVGTVEADCYVTGQSAAFRAFGLHKFKLGDFLWISEKPMLNEDLMMVAVTTTTYYMFDRKRIDGRTDEQLVDEFFRKYPLGQSHCARDTSKIGNLTDLLEVKVMTPEEVETRLGGEKLVRS